MGVCDYADCVHNEDGEQCNKACINDLVELSLKTRTKWKVKEDVKWYMVETSDGAYEDFNEFMEDNVEIVAEGWLEAVDVVTGEKQWRKFDYACDDWDFVDPDMDRNEEEFHAGYRESTDMDLTPTWQVTETEHPWLKGLMASGHDIWVRNWTPLAYDLLHGKNVGLLGIIHTADKLDIHLPDDMTMGEAYSLVLAKLKEIEAGQWWPKPPEAKQPEARPKVVKVTARPVKPTK